MLLYVHVPFCARRCSYCDFAIAVRRETPSDAFTQAILAEWRARLAVLPEEAGRLVDTVYFGGGTPSRLDPAAVATLLAGVRAECAIAPEAEVTVEANPDDVTRERAEAWQAAGVTRVSLGVQSFDPRVLAWMHRTHGPDEPEQAVAALRQAGITNLSLDLIYGVPGALARDWTADLDRALALRPPHLSLYALTIEPATPLGKWTSRGQAVAADDARVAEEYLLAHSRLRQEGYLHYEVSNAAQPGYRAVHNSGYWQGRPFLGLGPSAASGIGTWRGWNLREWEAWRRAAVAGARTLAGEEILGPAQQLTERQYLGLRTDAGLDTSLVPSASLETWRRSGWAVVSGGRVRLTAEGWLRLDALVAGLPGT